jgi:hypothetical protein
VDAVVVAVQAAEPPSVVPEKVVDREPEITSPVKLARRLSYVFEFVPHFAHHEIAVKPLTLEKVLGLMLRWSLYKHPRPPRRERVRSFCHTSFKLHISTLSLLL